MMPFTRTAAVRLVGALGEIVGYRRTGRCPIIRALLPTRSNNGCFSAVEKTFPRMLALQMAGKIDSWAIRWAYAHYKHNAFALLSFRPRVFHIGDDGSGTHTRRGSLRQRPLTSEFREQFQFPDQHDMDPHFVSELQKMTRPSIARKNRLRYFRDRLRRSGAQL